MKKKRIVLLFVALMVSMLCFTACGDKGDALSGSMRIVIATDAQSEAKVIEVSLDGYTSSDSVMDVLDKLADEKKLCYKGSKGVYGIYLTALGVPVESTYGGETSLVDSYILEESLAAHKSLYTYTNVEADKLETKPDAAYQAMTVEYDGQTLTESMNGVSKMQIRDGAVIYFTYLIWG
ncbi:MAG: hypothetical protein K2M95_01680 [Clostridiales bacterium]|nr:hypothetical protein [Clostridiales bacterium]